MTDGERFERGRQQNAAMKIALQVDIVGDEKIIDDRGEYLIDLARRRERPIF